MEKVYSKEATTKLPYYINIIYNGLVERYSKELYFINGGIGLKVGTTEVWYSKSRGVSIRDFGNVGYSTKDEVVKVIATHLINTNMFFNMENILEYAIVKQAHEELSKDNTYKINNLFYNGKNNYELFHNNLKLRSGVVDSIDPHAGSMVGLFHALNHAKNNGYDYIKVITVKRISVYYNKLLRTAISRDFHDKIVEKDLDKIKIVFSYVD